MNKKEICLLLFCLCLSWTEAIAQKNHNEWANYKRYEKANNELPVPNKKEKRVVFLGNSITEGWVNIHPEFFKENGYIGRGISGQTSYQFLLRFRNDVINLKCLRDDIETSYLTFGPFQQIIEQRKYFLCLSIDHRKHIVRFFSYTGGGNGLCKHIEHHFHCTHRRT